MKKYLITLLALSTLTFTSCSKDEDGLSKEDFKSAMTEALKENTEENGAKIEDPDLIGTWEASINDENGDPLVIKYVFNSDKTYETTNTEGTIKGTFYITKYGTNKRVVMVTQIEGDSFNMDSSEYEMIDGKLFLESRHSFNQGLLRFTKK